MRSNLPVTDREHLLDPGQTLVSVTDLKGRITYCNAAFVAASGFAKHELLGQPHNIVRHPDMPAEAFRDLWDTIAAGEPWTGLVKNRRKSGDFYWVRAHATPVLDGHRITGYLSVRSVPSREEVAAAETLYVQMRADAGGARPRLALHRGRLRRRDAVGRLLLALRIGARGRAAVAQLALAASVAGAALTLPPTAAVAAAVVLALVGHWALSRLLLRPFGAVLADARRLGAGDLTHPVACGADGLAGELQQALAQMVVNVRTLVADVRAEVNAVRGASAEIAAGNDDLSVRTESQAGNLQHTASTVEQINGIAQQTAQSAGDGSRLADEMGAVAEGSHRAVQDAAAAMERIAESSRRMGEMIGVVEGVAFQTNILALNAAVEAARAGDAGRGFAVVASEVRLLAQRSGDAARGIKQLIESTAGRVEAGMQQSSEARERMGQAMQSVAAVRALLTEIATAAGEQRSGVGQINAAIVQLDAMTQQNAAMVEQIAATSKSLDAQVAAVLEAIALFRLVPGERSAAEADAVRLRKAAREAAAA